MLEREMKDPKGRGNKLGQFGNLVEDSPLRQPVPGLANKVNLPSLLYKRFREFNGVRLGPSSETAKILQG
jgi:hypothetical protein